MEVPGGTGNRARRCAPAVLALGITIVIAIDVIALTLIAPMKIGP